MALPKQGGGRKHLRAMPHSEAADAVGRIRRSDAYATVRLTVEFAVLTAACSGEVQGVRWEEVNLDSTTALPPHGLPNTCEADAVVT